MTTATLPADTASADLVHWLDDFRARFNDNRRVEMLTKGWDRDLLVEATDTGASWTLPVRGARIADVREGGAQTGGDDQVTMSAETPTLIEIFAGRYNPSTALIDGQLEVYSNARDKVKLEALALVIWGL